MIRIAISAEAFEAIAATLPLGSVAFQPQATANGGRFIWLPEHVLNKLGAERRSGEDLSDTIIRLAGMECA